MVDRINYSIIDKPPYVCIHDDLPKIQKDLVYRVYIETLSDLIRLDSKFVGNLVKKNIYAIKHQDYNQLYFNACYGCCPIIVSYLISNNLVTTEEIRTVKCGFTKYSKIPYKYYISIMNSNIIKERTDVFDVYTFSRYIKYSDEFIDKHFNLFTRRYLINNKTFLHIFAYIDVQKPSFEILVKHIGEFDIEHAIRGLDLSNEQISELLLLKSMIGG